MLVVQIVNTVSSAAKGRDFPLLQGKIIFNTFILLFIDTNCSSMVIFGRDSHAN